MSVKKIKEFMKKNPPPWQFDFHPLHDTFADKAKDKKKGKEKRG